MKKIAPRDRILHSASLIGFALSLISVALAAVAFGLTAAQHSNSLTVLGLFHQVASALGVHFGLAETCVSPTPKGGAPVPSLSPRRTLQGTSQDQTAANYTGPHNNRR